MSQQGHHGRGNPAFTSDEVERHLKKNGPALTSELAEEYGVSDVAIRKRLKNDDAFQGVESRKIRNRLVWYVPHMVVEETDGGGYIGGFPVGAFYRYARNISIIFAMLTGALLGGHVRYGWPLFFAILTLLFAFGVFWAGNLFRDRQDPTMDLDDVKRSLDGEL